MSRHEAEMRYELIESFSRADDNGNAAAGTGGPPQAEAYHEPLGRLSAEEFVRDRPDAHWQLRDGEGLIVGRCSLWWEETPEYKGHQVGLIGHYFVQDACAAERLLRHACGQLLAQGCTFAAGPMDRDIWRTYRMMTEFGTEPIFSLEPSNPKSWPGHWAEAGFEPIGEYFSSLNEDLASNRVPVGHIEDRLRRRNIRVRPLDPTCFESELRNLFEIIPAIFCGNPFFTPIDEDAFIDLYRPVEKLIVSDLVMVAECHDRPVGFIFCLPDVAQAKRGQAIDTIIVKTLAVLPGQKYGGLGNLLLERAGSVASELGYERLIHALMRDIGRMRRISGRSARRMRGYTLFGRELS